MRLLDPKTAPRWLALTVVLQGLTLLGQWGAGPAATPARADLPDAGAQRNQVIDQLKGVNDRLDKLLATLASGDVRVKVATPEPTGRPQ